MKVSCKFISGRVQAQWREPECPTRATTGSNFKLKVAKLMKDASAPSFPITGRALLIITQVPTCSNVLRLLEPGGLNAADSAGLSSVSDRH